VDGRAAGAGAPLEEYVLTIGVTTHIVDLVVGELRTELKQTKPFRSLKHEALLSIQRTAAILEHEFESVLKPFAITGTQYNVLRILRGAGDNGLCRNEIRDRMVRQVPDVTRLLDRLEEMKLVVRKRSGTDRRYVGTTITAAGMKLLERLDDTVDAANDLQLGHIDDARLKALIGILAAVRHRE
jgi:DNA-binding MarR family transcriptional regulator